MFKLAFYILKRERKGLTLSLGLNLILIMMIRFDISFNLPIEKIYVFYTAFLLLFILERFSVQMEKQFASEESPYYLQIPMSMHRMLNGHLIAWALVYSIWFAMLFIVVKNNVFLLYFPLYVALASLCLFATALILVYSRFNLAKGYTSLAAVFTMIMSGLIGFIVLSMLKIKLPFLYNPWIGILSLMVLIGGASYLFLGRQLGGPKHKRFYRGVFLMCILLSVTVYGIGQMITYQNRKVEVLPKDFIEDQALQRKWQLVGIDYDSRSFEAIDVAAFAEGKLDLNHYYELEVFALGETSTDLKYTKGYLYNERLEVSQAYVMKQHESNDFLLVQWKGKGYVYRGKEPVYYVYKAE